MTPQDATPKGPDEGDKEPTAKVPGSSDADNNIVNSKGPLPDLLAIDLPFSMANNSDVEGNANKVFALLGGKRTLERALYREREQGSERQTGVNLFFQPETPMSFTNVESSVVHKTPMVMKLFRSKKTGEIKSAQVVGVVDDYRTFDKLSDFAYRPGPLNTSMPESPGLPTLIQERLPEAMSTVVKPGEERIHDTQAPRRELYIVPPSFSWTAEPCKDLNFAENAKEEANEISAFIVENSRDGILEVNLTIDRHTVPENFSKTLKEVPEEDHALVQRLGQAFQERPCWLLRGLFAKLETFSSPRVQMYLHRFCYRVSKGAFKDALVCYGFDPRSDRSASRFQTVHFPTSQLSEIIRLLDSETVQLCGVPVDKDMDSRVQFCDIRDKVIRHICISRVELKYHSENGWFTSAALQEVSLRLETLASMLAQALKDSGSVSGIPQSLQVGDAQELDPTEPWIVNGQAGEEPPAKRSKGIVAQLDQVDSYNIFGEASSPRSGEGRRKASTGSGEGGSELDVFDDDVDDDDDADLDSD